MFGSRLLGTGLALVTSLGLAVSASAAMIAGTAQMDQAQEVPPSGSSATGTIEFVLNTNTNLMSVKGEVTGISVADITLGGALAFGVLGPFHVHEAPAGANGPIQVPFADAGFFTDTASGLEILATVDASGLNVAALLAGDTYFNLHTLDFGGGEIRGQIAANVIPEPSAALLFAIGALGVGQATRRRH